jgi:hypothetical protein
MSCSYTLFPKSFLTLINKHLSYKSFYVNCFFNLRRYEVILHTNSVKAVSINFISERMKDSKHKMLVFDKYK